MGFLISDFMTNRFKACSLAAVNDVARQMNQEARRKMAVPQRTREDNQGGDSSHEDED